MRQFLESLIVLQAVTCSYSPTQFYFPLTVVANKNRRYKKWALYVAILLIAFIVQWKTFTKRKFHFLLLRHD
jgi:hypothetical protein